MKKTLITLLATTLLLCSSIAAFATGIPLYVPPPCVGPDSICGQAGAYDGDVYAISYYNMNGYHPGSFPWMMSIRSDLWDEANQTSIPWEANILAAIHYEEPTCQFPGAHGVLLIDNEIPDGLFQMGLYFTSGFSNARMNGYWECSTTPAPVPEPATVAMLGFGLIGLGASLRKKLSGTK